MKLRALALPRSAALALFVLAGCASAPPADVAKEAAAVGVYTSAGLGGRPYDVVGYGWVDTWRTAFPVPTYPTKEEAVASLRVYAAQLGADGLLDVVCLDQGRAQWFGKAEPAFVCYGSAIRVRPGAG